MKQGILTINAGSSSIKFALFSLDHPISPEAEVSGQIDGIGAETTRMVAKNKAGERIADQLLEGGKVSHAQAFDALLKWFTASHANWQIVAVGHRVVHGGERYSQPTVIDDTVLGHLQSFIPLAPLHEPHNVAGIIALQALLPSVPQIACFDTAFHRSQPEVAQTFGLPRNITAEGIKRYGFHGLSYEYIARALPQHSGRATGRVVVAHLGNGASMAAMVDRKCVATTLGFSTIDGLVMGTRCGNLDPGVILHLMETKNLSVKDMTKMLYKESGLLGVSGLSQDMRTLLASDKPEAGEAVNLFCYRIARELGSLAAAAGGLDALVFTGGIGEHAAEVRRRVCLLSEWLGIRLNPEANARHELRISAGNSSVDVLVIPTNEEWMMAHHAQTLLAL
ncbi:acetate/propionate family kinase [Ferribacterium limneticum]|uniref:acetate/propionate family kinase n=1 Tax=Ferribacterium limneticum TaxID=76259 RepID=UPI001CFC22F4|nr:acetate/propionate family kinase [Ferribacterium limneticum]UCV27446.1 acetate/propionate family kinase [Ferribacterium limneticum]UCV31363.1 acetate/propionate family kinase [Ferribacterium limneticum]